MEKNNPSNLPETISEAADELTKLADLQETPGSTESEDFKDVLSRANRVAAQFIELAVRDMQSGSEKASMPPCIFTELNYLSMGMHEDESGVSRGLTKNEVKWRRRKVKSYMGSKSRNQIVADAIQRGLIAIETADEETASLSPMEGWILKLAAIGWTSREIGDLYKISFNTIDRHYEDIREKLGAKNMPHAVRRAFELSIFKIGEPIEPPIAQKEVSIGLSNAQERLRVEDQREIELLTVIAGLDSWLIHSKKIMETEFFRNLDPRPRASIYGRTMRSVARKINACVGEDVVSVRKLRIHGNRTIVYLLNRSLEVSIDGVSYTIPGYGEKDLEGLFPRRSKAESKRKATQPKKSAEPKIEAIESEIPLQEDAETVAAEEVIELPPLDEALLKSLKPRPKTEVLQNHELKLALLEIAKQVHMVNGYRAKMILAIRHGIPATSLPYFSGINRGGENISFDRFGQYIKPFRGLDLKSSELLTGMTRVEILEAELDLLNQHVSKYPALAELKSTLESQLSKLQKAKSE